MKSASQNKLALEKHPYGSFVPKGAKVLILGTFPAWEFSTQNRKQFLDKTMIDFNYGRIHGSKSNLLWRILSELYEETLISPTEIKRFLTKNKIALADVYSAVTRKVARNSSDQNLVGQLNEELVTILEKNPTIQTVLCTGKGVKAIFERKFFKRIKREDLKVVALPSPSRSADRTFGREPDFNRKLGSYHYRLKKYAEYFPFK